MELTELLVRAIEGQVVGREEADCGQVHFECTRDEIRVEVGEGEVYIWRRVERFI